MSLNNRGLGRRSAAGESSFRCVAVSTRRAPAATFWSLGLREEGIVAGAVEMWESRLGRFPRGGGKRGKPQSGFPGFPWPRHFHRASQHLRLGPFFESLFSWDYLIRPWRRSWCANCAGRTSAGARGGAAGPAWRRRRRHRRGVCPSPRPGGWRSAACWPVRSGA